ncbi:hypothetical protein KZP23_14550 [Echinicola marina]|uniref:hypothetical protein n=1 Tax=Echinicola marina TaxID=2859768 RepID=UPI001CF6BED0|nr:hypothetical protein [Echinicola marina]UCS91943.1 hypothetical protein KZP23_14550 [Echinicola marina]
MTATPFKKNQSKATKKGLVPIRLKQYFLKKAIPFLALYLSSIPSIFAQSFCGEVKPLLVRSQMPYIGISVDGHKGYFLIDYAATVSTIDTSAFVKGHPSPIGPSTYFNNFDFYGSWGKVTLFHADYSPIQGLGEIKQAGIIGTDFLSLNAFLLDYENGKIYRSKEDECTESWLSTHGFKAVSTAGYFADQKSKLQDNCTFNVPTIPVRIGKAMAMAQIDPGFDDGLYPFSVNINKAFFDAIEASGLSLEELPEASLSLSTCIDGITEEVKAYQVADGSKFEIIGMDGSPVMITSDFYIFLKNPPSSIYSCGGIGTWKIPAAQFGASFLAAAKQVFFDPFHSKVWFKKTTLLIKDDKVQ